MGACLRCWSNVPVGSVNNHPHPLSSPTLVGGQKWQPCSLTLVVESRAKYFVKGGRRYFAQQWEVRRPGHLDACPTLTGGNVADGDGWLSDLVLCSVRTGSEYISSTTSYRASL